MVLVYSFARPEFRRRQGAAAQGRGPLQQFAHMVSAPSCAATLTDAAWIPARFDASTARSHIIIMGMSRSGSSLTSSLVSEVLLGRTPQSWRGSGAPLPADGANPLGYYERRDVVSLNYELIRALGHPHWSSFAPTHARCPSTPNLTHTLASTSKWPTLEARMRAIVDDMNTFSPWLLKDVRFSRTLLAWAPYLPRGGPVCIIPYRHPLEVAASSKLKSTAAWEGYVTAALASARTLRCPTMLVDYSRWFEEPCAQLDEMLAFLRCAGIPQIPTKVSCVKAQQIIRPSQRHLNSSSIMGIKPAGATSEEKRKLATGSKWSLLRRPKPQPSPPLGGAEGGLTASQAQLWTELRSGEALRLGPSIWRAEPGCALAKIK